MTRKRYFKLVCALSTEINNNLLDGIKRKHTITYQLDRHIDFKEAGKYGVTSYQEAWDNVTRITKTVLPNKEYVIEREDIYND